ncbi:hypothetical protein [Marinilabilia sp.]
MKQLFYFLSILLAISLFSACEKEEDSEEVSELKEEIQELKSILESESSITGVSFEGSDMLLTFANGSEVKVAAPGNIIPQVGPNGNWWVNGEDLGVPARAEMPSIGENGNWWIGDTDTGVKAEGSQGTPGEDGTGIASVSYDPETAILTILLTDETSYEYVLFHEEALQGIKLGDLNGKYLLDTIYNGDLPFATFEYNANNQLTDIKYFKAELNKPTLQVALHREFNTDNKIISQTLTEYSTIEKAVPVGYYLPHRKWGIEMTPEEAFNQIYPNGLEGYTGTAVEFFEEISWGRVFDSGYSYEYHKTRYYETNPDGSETYTEKKYVLRQLLRGDESKQFSVSVENGQTYVWTPEYYSFWNNSWSDYYDNAMGYYATDVTVNNYGNIYLDYEKRISVSIYRSCYPVTEYSSSSVDEIAGNRLSDYIALEAGTYENPDNLTGNYKFLFGEYDLYEPGDEIRSATFNYVYDGDNYAVSKEGEAVYNISVVDERIEGVTYQSDTETVELLQMNYVNNQLVSITSPHYIATEVVTIEYDGEGNPVNFLVNSKDLAGQGHDAALAELGLAYKSEVYDSELGKVVEKYFYPESATSLLKLKYDYSMKNFMNHSITAMNPLLSVFNTNNAIQEFIWAGHGSGFIAEYDSFNEGGYPTRFKGLLRISPQDHNSDDEHPINGSVATTYRLTYKKIAE